jgi:hypothetical protein
VIQSFAFYLSDIAKHFLPISDFICSLYVIVIRGFRLNLYLFPIVNGIHGSYL